MDGSEASIIMFLNSDTRKSKVSNEEFLKMEGLLTENELTDTLMNFMKGASAPGIDGFTVNWLRQFWPELKTLVRLALNEMYDESTMSTMCRLAFIRLLRKGNKSPLLPGNYRPIFFTR